MSTGIWLAIYAVGYDTMGLSNSREQIPSGKSSIQQNGCSLAYSKVSYIGLRPEPD